MRAPFVGNLAAARPQGLESWIEPPELGGGSGGSLSALKPLGEKPEKSAALMRYPLIRINVSTCHIGLASNNSPKRLFLCC